MAQGQIFKDPASGKTILVDGALASIFYAFDRYADKAVINATLARTFGFDQLKNARSLLYQAFSLQDDNGRIPDKRTEETLLKDLWEKVSRIDMKGHGDVVICMPYNFSIPQFISDADYTAEATRDTCSAMLLERMNSLEKKVEEKNAVMMNLVQSIGTKCNLIVPSVPQPMPPSFVQSYATAAASRLQGRPQHLAAPGGSARDRSPSVKRMRGEQNHPSNKRRNTEKQIVTGTRTNDRIRKMKSPPVDIFVYGVPKDTMKADIVDDLAESDIQISIEDIVLMSKGNPSVVSYKVSVKAEDLQKALDPAVWPLRVKVREFIHYRRRQPAAGQSTSRQQAIPDGNRYTLLENDVSA